MAALFILDQLIVLKLDGMETRTTNVPEDLWRRTHRGYRGGTTRRTGTARARRWRLMEKRGYRPRLPSLSMGNVRSLANKMDEPAALVRSQKEDRECGSMGSKFGILSVIILLNIPAVYSRGRSREQLQSSRSLGQSVRVTCSLQTICALQESAVDLKCSFSNITIKPQQSFWFSPKQKIKWRNEEDPEDLALDSDYAGRVSYNTSSSASTLTIRELRERDSGEYHLMLITETGEKYPSSTAITLTVSDLQIKMISDTEKQKWTLNCSTSCSLTPTPYNYYWYKNGQYRHSTNGHQKSLYSYETGSYSCSVSGHPEIWSSSVCFRDENCWSVIYSDRRVCVLEGSSVDFPCTYSYPSGQTVTETAWFYSQTKEEGKDLRGEEQFAARAELIGDKERICTLRVRNVSKSDSGEYRYRFSTNPAGGSFSGTPGVTLRVTDLQVIPSAPSGGQTVTLTCSSTCTLPNNPTYIWFKNGQPVTSKPTRYNKLYLESARPEDVLQYSCALGSLGQSVRVTCSLQTICALQESAVDLKCSYSNITIKPQQSFWFSPKQKAKWRNEEDPEDLALDSDYARRVSYNTSSSASTLTIRELRERDSGEYHLMLITETGEKYPSSTAITLTVSDLQMKMISDTEKQKWTLNCSTSCSLTPTPYNYYWYKNGQYRHSTNGHQKSLYSYETGSYSCSVSGHPEIWSSSVCFRDENCWSVIYSDRRVCVLEGSSVDFPCTYSYPSGQAVTETAWFYSQTKEEGKDLRGEEQFAARVELVGDKERICTLRVRNVSKSDSGEYRYRFSTNPAGGSFSGTPGVTLRVTDLQVIPSAPSGGQTVTLTCSSTCTLPNNPTYIWFKNGQPVTSKPTRYNKLYLESARPEDVLQYSCALGSEDSTVMKLIMVGVAVFLALILMTGLMWRCVIRRKRRAEIKADVQKTPNPVDDTYTPLNPINTSSDYDTLRNVTGPHKNRKP
ncbi:sialoadhesin-like [Salminus brasiliensis]|uniref:sialoadhesin-like n=1 Tax=Salminus brasiliensis TaxID=930266 RepID=UPI003B830089